MFVHRCHRPRHRFLEVVSNLLGHPDTKPTIRYLGLRTDDMVSATRVLDRVRPPLQETVEDCNRGLKNGHSRLSARQCIASGRNLSDIRNRGMGASPTARQRGRADARWEDRVTHLSPANGAGRVRWLGYQSDLPRRTLPTSE